MKESKLQLRARRHKKIRSRISGTPTRPRLSVWKSNKFIYAQIIDDEVQKTIVAASSVSEKAPTPLERAKKTGMKIAKLALAKKLKKIVFDRGGYLYAGNIKAFADGAREGGLEF